MEILEPLAVEDVSFAAGDIFDVSGVDQTYLEASFFQDLEQGDPIDAGGLHRDGLDLAGSEPIGQSM